MILVTGGSGQLGTAFREIWPDAWYPTHRELDLSDLASLRSSLVDATPDLIVNCAAYTAVDAAEEHEGLATAVNGDAVGVLATYAASHKIPMVTFSTDYVFAGTAKEPYVESHSTDPINAYGRSKLRGEQLALAAYPDSLVVRTSWVISATHRNFVATILRLVRERDEVRVVDDQQGIPTVATDLAAATVAALEAGAGGLLHLTNSGPTTWYQLARRAAAVAGLDVERIVPCSTSEFPTPAVRPAYSVLGSERRESLGLHELPHWESSLPAVVAGHR